MRNSVPWRGLSKSEEAADGDAVGGETIWNTGFTCVSSHNAGQYTTCFSGRANRTLRCGAKDLVTTCIHSEQVGIEVFDQSAGNVVSSVRNNARRSVEAHPQEAQK